MNLPSLWRSEDEEKEPMRSPLFWDRGFQAMIQDEVWSSVWVKAMGDLVHRKLKTTPKHVNCICTL
jgi:hypothetical protein